MEKMVNFWKDKKVLITGHTGFKGSWLSLWLQTLQADLVGFALSPPTSPNLFTAAGISKHMKDIRGDIMDYSLLANTMIDHQPEIIFHLAAQPLVRHSYSNPLGTYATNVMGTVHLLEAARLNPRLKVIINVTTDKCYENKNNQVGFRETDSLGGDDPYSSSKSCSELVTQAYRASFLNHEIGLASARAGNVIGGGDWAEERLMPDIIRSWAENKPLVIRYPEAIRPWQHVLECLAGYLHLAKKLYSDSKQFSCAWNFGPDDQNNQSVGKVTNSAFQLLNIKKNWQFASDSKKKEAVFLKLDCTKANTELNWKPKWHFQQALNATITWYQAYYQGEDAHKMTTQQIMEYSLAQ